MIVGSVSVFDSIENVSLEGVDAQTGSSSIPILQPGYHLVGSVRTCLSNSFEDREVISAVETPTSESFAQ